jgi:hypothetical protein
MIEKLTTKVSINTQGEAIRFANECYEVAEEFAIGFAEWMLGDDAWRVTEETLEIYKKTL